MTVARESFLEKLKREREEANQQTKLVENVQPARETTVAHLPTFKAQAESSSSSEDSSPEEEAQPVKVVQNGHKKVASSSSSSSDSDSDEDDLVLRKKSKRFGENGKVGFASAVSVNGMTQMAKNFRSKSTIRCLVAVPFT